MTSSGMLPPCEHVRISDCLDGTSNTMIVGEQSDWLLDQNQAKSQKYHGDPGWTVGGTGPGGGWLSGTRGLIQYRSEHAWWSARDLGCRLLEHHDRPLSAELEASDGQSRCLAAARITASITRCSRRIPAVCWSAS